MHVRRHWTVTSQGILGSLCRRVVCVSRQYTSPAASSCNCETEEQSALACLFSEATLRCAGLGPGMPQMAGAGRRGLIRCAACARLALKISARVQAQCSLATVMQSAGAGAQLLRTEVSAGCRQNQPTSNVRAPPTQRMWQPASHQATSATQQCHKVVYPSVAFHSLSAFLCHRGTHPRYHHQDPEGTSIHCIS